MTARRGTFPVLLALVVLAASGDVQAQMVPNFDHLKCYKVKDFLPKKSYAVQLIPEQNPPFNFENCKLQVPAKLFCIDVIKTNVQPPPPGGVNGTKTRDYFCYAIKCQKQQLPTILARDQFGVRDVTIKPPKFLCAPAEKEILHATPSPTPTRTPTPPPLPTETPTPARTPTCEFDSVVGQCAGPCPPSSTGAAQQCVWVVNADGTAGCDCREPDPACDLTATGICGGPCPDPRDQCRAGTPGTTEPPCVCKHPCSLDPFDPTTPPTCSGECPNPADVCLVVPGTTDCRCTPPVGNPPCGSTTAPTCDGTCPNPGEACVPTGGPGSPCFCETGTPPVCGQLQGNPQCLGACPANTACVTVGPVPGGSCTCQ